MMQAKTSNSVTDYGKLNALAQLVSYRLDDLFEKLEVDLRRCGKMYIGCCPVHCGDNYSALNLYPEEMDGSPAGHWLCRTHKCHTTFKTTIIGFVRGVLSTKYFNWTEAKPKERLAPFQKVLDWLCKFVGQSWNGIKVDEKVVEYNQFASQVQVFKEVSAKATGVSRQAVRNHLQIPAVYYIQRKYLPETLDFFDVGLCTQPGKEMYNRVVVPIYDAAGKYMVGCTARSIFEKCPQCRLYHDVSHECPNKASGKNFTKWRHSGNTGSYLYNWWNAKEHIRTRGNAVIVEGPGDVWRLWEAGIYNAVAMFGADITDEQQIILERSGAMKLYVIRDNDAAGEISEGKLREQLQNLFKLQFIVPPAKDVGEMTVEQIKQEIVPCLK